LDVRLADIVNVSEKGFVALFFVYCFL